MTVARVVQTSAYGNVGSGANPVAFASPVTNNNTVIVGIFITSWIAPPASVTDDQFNSYDLDNSGPTLSAGSAEYFYVYRCSNVTNAPQTITVTVTGRPSKVVAYEVYGLTNSAPKDVFSIGTYAPATSTPSFPFTLTEAGEFVFGMLSNNTAGSPMLFTAGTAGIHWVNDVVTPDVVWFEHYAPASAASYVLDGTMAGSGSLMDFMVASYKSAGGSDGANIPKAIDLATLDYSWRGSPFAFVEATTDADTKGLDFSWQGSPFFGHALSVQVLLPASDISAGSWVPSTGATLYGTIDEAIADDADYDYTKVTSSMTVKLAAGSDPAVSAHHKIRYRIRGTGNLQVQLLQGATVIATWTHFPAPGAFNTYAQILSDAEADSITDYTDLRLKFSAGAITQVGSSVVGTVGNPLNLTVPVGTAAGDVLFVHHCGANFPNLNGSFTNIANGTDGDGVAYRLSYHVCTGAETSFNFDNSVPNTFNAAIMNCFRGVDNATPYENFSGANVSNNATFTASSISASKDNSIWLTFWQASDASSTVTTPPAGATQAGITQALPIRITDFYKPVNSGATGTATLTWNHAEWGYQAGLILRPAG